MYKIGICGHFGNKKNLLNGQTVKTKIITNELSKQLGEDEITTVDTHNWKRNPFKLLVENFNLIKKSNNIIILPAHRGIKVFVPLFLLFNIFFNRKLYYIVIGGWLPEILQNNLKLKNRLKKFDGIYVETKSMMKDLNKLGLLNVDVIPNFKVINVLKEDELRCTNKQPFKVCTFSRVMKEKGIEDAINVIIKINSEAQEEIYNLDIYGQVEKGYEKRFEELQKNFPSYIKYKGLVEFDKATDILKNYFLLLFPTKYEGEGFPGTVLDAFASGVPIVATDWKYNSEIIINNKTGFIYNNNIENFDYLLKDLANNPKKVLSLKNNCLNEINKYNPNIVISKLLKKMKVD